MERERGAGRSDNTVLKLGLAYVYNRLAVDNYASSKAHYRFQKLECTLALPIVNI